MIPNTSSLPTRMEHNAPASTPSIVAGIVIFNISNNVMSKPANKPSNATVAAEMGPVSYTHLDVYKRQQ